MSHIAVIDIGKTNAKLALVEAGSLRELDVVTRPNRVLPGPPYPHMDLEGHWQFFLHHLAALQASHGIDAISVTTHGAAAVLLAADGALAAPMLDYEHDGPDSLAPEYDALRPGFARTGAPRLPRGLNIGAQLHWLLARDPGLADRVAHILTYPGYWGWRLTGVMSCDVTSLGCHTDLWEPAAAQFSPLVKALGLHGKMAPARKPAERLGTISPQVAQATGLPADTPVSVGIHDSNASLYPYLLARPSPFAVVSTGTWVVAMAMGARPQPLDPARDVLVNVNALGQPVPSARFMGGREFDQIRAGSMAQPDAADYAAVRRGPILLLPAVEPASGPFAGRQMRWTQEPQSAGARMLALSHYLAMMTQTCLDLIGAQGPAQGPVIVEGPFARNPDYLAMLAAICPAGVEVAQSATGTSAGAALLALGPEAVAAAPLTQPVPRPKDAAALSDLAAQWRARL